VDTRLSRRPNSGLSAQQTRREIELVLKIGEAVRADNSVLVTGEAGTGLSELAMSVREELMGDFSVATAIYKGSLKQFFQAIAFQLDIPIEDENGKPLIVDRLKEEIAMNIDENTLLIFPEAKRLTTSIRYWLEDLIANGVKLVGFATVNPNKDIFLEMLEIELELPDDRAIRSVMEQEAELQGLSLSRSRLAELQPLAGRNPMLARKVIRREKLGIKQESEHTQYVVVMPAIVAMLFSFAVVRFVGLGTGNHGLYITGGICLVAAMALKQLGNIRGARKRLGQ
jgi:hypothetical protein